VSSHLTGNNKVTIGRVLPVVLAILFVGSADHPLRPGASPATGRSVNASHSGERGTASRRAALCLLPALLRQVYESGAQVADSFTVESRTLQVHVEAVSVLNADNTACAIRSSLAIPPIGQRPPPLSA
jgi:hypothetical protein